MMIQKPERNVEIINEYRPFLYKLVGTWAFSPHPRSAANETFLKKLRSLAFLVRSICGTWYYYHLQALA